jgi:hypothetical protein
MVVDFTFTATGRQHRVLLENSDYSTPIDYYDVRIKQNGFSTENLSADLEYSAGSEYQRVCKLTHTLVDTPEYDVTLESEYDKEEIQVGLMLAGTAEGLASSHVDISDATDDYSRIQFDETYGTAELLQRGFSRILSVTLQVDGTDGAYVHHRLRSVRATPVLWDFNNFADADDGLIVHGLAQRPERRVSGHVGLDTIRMQVKGMVE